MPLEQALGVMAARFQVAYEKGGIAWREVEATVKSAYKKGIEPKSGYGGVVI